MSKPQKKPTSAANKPKDATMLDAAICWGKAEGKTRGIFTRRFIAKGEVIERAPVIPVPKENMPEEGPPDGYVLDWSEDNPDEAYVLVGGYIMFYNHCEEPNVHLESDFENGVVESTALRDIEAGEELTWNYNCELWFDPV